MLVLTIRTDNPWAEVGLFDDQIQLAYEKWHAHRELSLTIHQKIRELLHGQRKELQDLEGIVCYEGPGSFTGLRIGLSVGNALAYGLKKPIVASGGNDWIQQGAARLRRGEADSMALPQYGSSPHITLPKK